MVPAAGGQAPSTPLATALTTAIEFAGQQLSLLVERDVQVRGTALERVRLEHLPELLGGAEQCMTMVYLAFSGEIEGHAILTLSSALVAQLVSLLLGEEIGEAAALDPMSRSALGEAGNIITAAFLNALAEACRLTVHPSPPAVVYDMIGALLDAIIIEMALDSPWALLAHTEIEVDGSAAHGELVLLPAAASYETLERRLA